MSYKSERSFERSMIPHEYIEELTRRTDIVELVGSYVQLLDVFVWDHGSLNDLS